MDTPATAALWIIIMAIFAFGASLGGITWVYFTDKRRSGSPTALDQDRAVEQQSALATSESQNMEHERERQAA